MLRYIISVLLLFCSLYVEAQSTSSNEEVQIEVDTIPYSPPSDGLRIGADIFSPIWSMYNGRESYGSTIDTRVYDRYFINGQFGIGKSNFKNDFIEAVEEGKFFKIGVNYDLFKRTDDENNMVYIGLRYGSAFVKQKMNYVIKDNDPKMEFSKSLGLVEINPHFMEFCFGIEVEITSMIYFGWSLNIGHIIHGRAPDDKGAAEAIYIPGLGMHNDGLNLHFQYNVSFFLPYRWFF
ncbi:DUF6048 family protein [Ichthyobacterium seriolicida]|uniref:Outer membrane protein beta-barrel domain-containing protein n=1 Tax=Ichthyobacterium seriolicida TaxID=242600 RepID=A0A1J1DWG2_9FLAO|nr:DUF6048 family protein [Ichthyobacterium seriolicida]BAV94207.1 hypothetical protein JBKA6_0194 [Ichthyobacterium seriolicida]